MILSIEKVDEGLRHYLTCELHILENLELESWCTNSWVRVALEQIAAKQIEAIELSFLKSSTPADKYATLIWISGPFDEPLELSNGVIKTDRFDS